MIEGVEPDAIKVASPVLNGGDEETGLVRPRLVATQLHSPSGKVDPDRPCLECQPVEPAMRCLCKAGTHAYSIGWERMGIQVNLMLPWRKTGEPQSGDGAFSNTP